MLTIFSCRFEGDFLVFPMDIANYNNVCDFFLFLFFYISDIFDCIFTKESKREFLLLLDEQ